MTKPVAVLTIDLADLLATGSVVVHAPAPALVTKINCEHVGLTPRQFSDALRSMRHDPLWSERVIAHGKVRAVAPADLVAYLRTESAKVPSDGLGVHRAEARQDDAPSERARRWIGNTPSPGKATQRKPKR